MKPQWWRELGRIQFTVDDETIIRNDSGEAVAKDIAIGGDSSDLASVRGQIGNYASVTLTADDDFNDFLKAGVYCFSWSNSSKPVNAPTWGVNGMLVVYCSESTGMVKQLWYRLGTADTNDHQFLIRTYIQYKWGTWHFAITNQQIGDGIKVSGDKVSVPEMTGATTSDNGVAGLVPPPAKADLGKSLTADGDWSYPADVAIGGNLEDLASARGFFYDKYVPWYAGTPADTYLITDFNEFKKPGRYHIRWREGTPASTGEEVTANNPNLGNGAGVWFDAILEIDGLSPASFVTSNARIVQRVIVTNTVNNQNSRIASRLQAGNTWYPWKVTTLNSDFGDGLRITNYKISVPEMEGATASANGTAGLVPPATAGQQESFLTGGGEYKPALSTSGGTITGELNIAAPAGGSEGGEITLINGTDGKYPAKIDTTRNLIRFFGGPSNPVSVDLETGRFVGNLTGKADTAGIADNSLAFANGRRWVEVIYEGNPSWVIGSVNEELRPVNPSSLNVNYANSAGYANTRFLNTFAFATANTGVNLPAGGTWLVFAQWYSYGGDYWEVSGKQSPWIDYRAGGSRIEKQRLGFALRIS